jgi:hypothetical protein
MEMQARTTYLAIGFLGVVAALGLRRAAPIRAKSGGVCSISVNPA